MSNGEPVKAVIQKPENETPTLPAPKPQENGGVMSRYQGASQRPFDEKVASILAKDFEDSCIEVKPHNGVLFYPGGYYIRRLIEAFGPGGWALIPVGQRVMRDNTMNQEFALYCRGQFVSQAVGDQDWIPSNRDMSEADAAEGCKTNAIQRCCKALGIGTKLQDPGFREKWKAENCVEVWVKGSQGSKTYWRRKDRAPLKGETGQAQPSAPPVEAPSPSPSPNVARPASAPTASSGGPVISDKQAGRFYAIWKKNGKTAEQVHDYLMERFKIGTDKLIPRSGYDEACAWAETRVMDDGPDAPGDANDALNAAAEDDYKGI